MDIIWGSPLLGYAGILFTAFTSTLSHFDLYFFLWFSVTTMHWHPKTSVMYTPLRGFRIMPADVIVTWGLGDKVFKRLHFPLNYLDFLKIQNSTDPESVICIHVACHIWELPGNCHDFTRVMVFYLFCRRSMRILFAVVFVTYYIKYIYSLMIFIFDNHRVIMFWNYLATFIYR